MMGKPWFASKRIGYGSSLPISWEGWAVVIGFVAAAMTLFFLTKEFLPAQEIRLARLIGMIILLAAFALVARAKTEGGWRWRNGNE